MDEKQGCMPLDPHSVYYSFPGATACLSWNRKFSWNNKWDPVLSWWEREKNGGAPGSLSEAMADAVVAERTLKQLIHIHQHQLHNSRCCRLKCPSIPLLWREAVRVGWTNIQLDLNNIVPVDADHSWVKGKTVISYCRQESLNRKQKYITVWLIPKEMPFSQNAQVRDAYKFPTPQ